VDDVHCVLITETDRIHIDEWFGPHWFDRPLCVVLLSAPSMNRRLALLTLSRMLRTGLSVGLVLLILAIAPFAVAQDVHHELAAADRDGHEHSDNDLCQWVQHHTSGSLTSAIPPFAAWASLSESVWFPVTVLVSSSFFSVGPSRAPPRS
jgi:hypothetical protein